MAFTPMKTPGAAEDSALMDLIRGQYLENGSYFDLDEAHDASRRLDRAVFDVTLGSSWVEVTASHGSAATQSAFLHGGCGYIAGELHRLARLPLVRFTSPDDRFGWRGHWAVDVAPGVYMDIRGEVNESEVLAEFAGSKSWTVERGDHLYGELVGQVGPEATTVLDDLDELERVAIGRYVRQLMATLEGNG